MMQILLLGNTGQLGWELNRTLMPLGEVSAFDYPDVDMADADSIKAIVSKTDPELIINATAYTTVDKAESEPELAIAINGTGPGILMQEANQIGAALIHYSTDYVFDGAKGSSYIETDKTNPLCVYGSSKLAGEESVMKEGGKHIIFRTSWVYSLRVGGFVNKFLGWAEKNDTLTIVDDQVGNPTWARMLAEITAQLVCRYEKELLAPSLPFAGLYHLAGSGHCSRMEWARGILEETGQTEIALLPGKTADFPAPAERPLFSALDCSTFEETFGLALPHWRDTLSLAMHS